MKMTAITKPELGSERERKKRQRPPWPRLSRCAHTASAHELSTKDENRINSTYEMRFSWLTYCDAFDRCLPKIDLGHLPERFSHTYLRGCGQISLHRFRPPPAQIHTERREHNMFLWAFDFFALLCTFV